MDNSVLNESHLSVNDSRMQFVRPQAYNPNSSSKKVAFDEDQLYSQEDQPITTQKPRNRGPKSNTATSQPPPLPKKTIQVNFGPGAVQDKIYNFKNNYISTTK